MTLSPPDWQRVSDMLAFLDRAQRHLEGRTRRDLDCDELFQDGLMRCLSVIGEASYKISKECQQRHSHIPWWQIAAFRHVLVHDYGQVNLDRVWLICQENLATLVAQLRPLIAEPPQE